MNETMKVSKPPLGRWVLATLAAWLASPVFAPFAWQFMVVEGIDPGSFLFVMFWTYFIGLPVAAPCVIILVAIVFLLYARLHNQQWFIWGLLGAGLGVLLALAVYMFGSDGPYDEVQPLSMWLSGPIPGFFAAIIFRRVLMKDVSQ